MEQDRDNAHLMPALMDKTMSQDRVLRKGHARLVVVTVHGVIGIICVMLLTVPEQPLPIPLFVRAMVPVYLAI